MANTVVTSKRFSLSLNDWTKGLLMAVVAPVIKIVIDSVNAGSMTFNWGSIGKVALAAGLAYLLKNFVDKPKIVVTDASKETVQAVKDGDKEVKITNT